MVVLKVIIFTALILASFVKAEQISFVEVDCIGRGECTTVIPKFKELSGKDYSDEGLYKFFSNELSKPFYKSFYFERKGTELHFEIEVKNKVLEVEIIGDDDILVRRVREDISIKVGDYFDEHVLDQNLEKISALYFKQNREGLKVDISETTDGIKLSLRLSKKGVRTLKSIKVEGLDKPSEKVLLSICDEMVNKTWSRVLHKRKVEEFKAYMEKLGHWDILIEEEIVETSPIEMDVTIKINPGIRYGFSFNGITFFHHKELITEFKKIVKNRKVSLNKDTVIQSLMSLYKERGVFFSQIDVRDVHSLDDDRYNFFFVNVKEGRRVKLSDIAFSGGLVVSKQELMKIFNDNSSTLLARGYLDLGGLDKIAVKLREYYISNGFIYSYIEDPIIVFSEDNESSFVTFKIAEKGKFFVKSINVEGVEDPKLISKIKEIMVNKEGKSFDVTSVDNDLKNVLEAVKDEGYFFTSFKEKNPKKIISVSSATKSVDINLKFSTGHKSFLGDVIVTGNLDTRDIVIKREIKLKKGDLVTPRKINDFVQRLRTLGLFSRVNITPFIGQKKNDDSIFLNFIVKVKEKDFGRGEVAPGYRTDLGYKVSGTISYNNLMGMNRSFIGKAQANLRTSERYLDQARRDGSDRIEGLLQFQYIEPYLFDFPVEWRTSIKIQRKRYSDFDADIFGITPTLTKSFTDSFTGSLEYEYDVIRQYDATSDDDEDRYAVGAITPSFTWDLRDNSIAPRSGAWFNFSWEFANPYFLSQDDPDFTVNYNRAVLKSYFYAPIGKFVLATALTAGVEKNFATDPLLDEEGNQIFDDNGDMTTIGYIPKLKVFRLSSGDVLRGYSDDESSRLQDGTDVSDVFIRDKAYMLNFKLEPRYYLSDTSVVAFFFDAGRVYKDSFQPLKLNTSAGISFKILTPVGSLDFDYGVKLRRKRYSDSDRDSFGRLHVSIGQF